MTKMNMIAALNSALEHQLIKDENVVIFGEDVGYFGGVFRVTAKLQEKFGPHRVFDSPLAEGGIAAIAMGMGLNGLRPVAEIQFADYIFPAYDQIVNEIAKLRHRSGGENLLHLLHLEHLLVEELKVDITIHNRQKHNLLTLLG